MNAPDQGPFYGNNDYGREYTSNNVPVESEFAEDAQKLG